MAHIYHITKAADWETAKHAGSYFHPSLQQEGFIHCAQEQQVEGVLQRYFHGQDSLVKLTIDTEKLISRLVYDWSPSTADTFPHIYGEINTDAVIEVSPV